MRIFAVFLIVLFAGDRLLALGLDQAIHHSSLPYAKLYSGRGKADVLVLGNSRAFRHFDEKQLSRDLQLRVSNLALLGSSMEIMNGILNDYISRYGPPKALIIEASCMSADNEQIRNMRVFARHSQNLQNILKGVSPVLYYAGNVSNLFNFNGSMILNVFHKMVSPYSQQLLVGSASFDSARQGTRPYFFSRDSNSIALQKIVGTVSKYGIHTEVIISPVIGKLLTQDHQHKNWLSSIANIVADHGHVTSYASMVLPRNAFYDPVHLNRAGAKLFFNTLLEEGIIDRLRSSSAKQLDKQG